MSLRRFGALTKNSWYYIEEHKGPFGKKTYKLFRDNQDYYVIGLARVKGKEEYDSITGKHIDIAHFRERCIICGAKKEDYPTDSIQLKTSEVKNTIEFK